MRKVILAPRAQNDLADITGYLFEVDGPFAAAYVISGLHSAMAELADGRTFGHRRLDLTDRPVLFYVKHNYYVVHRIRDDALEVVRVLHTARDIPPILR